MSGPTLADVIAVLESAYPPALAESWDSVGLVCGDPADVVTRVVFAVDPTEAVVDDAIASGADLLVVHHPLLLRGVDTVGAHTPKVRWFTSSSRRDAHCSRRTPMRTRPTPECPTRWRRLWA